VSESYKLISSQRKTLGELAKYGIIGVSSNLTLYIAYIFLTGAGVGHKTSMTLLYAVGTLLTFLLNKTWTFKHKGDHAGSLTRYLITYFSGYVTNVLFLVLLVDTLKYDHRIVQFFLIFLVAIQLFVIQRLWVFRVAKEK